MLFRSLKLDRLFSLSRNIKVGETGYCYIIDKQGSIIAHPEFTEKVLTNFNAKGKGVEGIDRILQGENGASVYSDLDGNKVVGGYALAPSTNWGILVEQQYTEITNQGKAALKRTFIISIFFVLAGLVASILFARVFTKPISSMVQVANKIKDGDLTERITVNANNEVGILQKTIDRKSVV